MVFYEKRLFKFNCFLSGLSVLFIFFNKGLGVSEDLFLIIDLAMSVSLSSFFLTFVAGFFYILGCRKKSSEVRGSDFKSIKFFQLGGVCSLLLVLGLGVFLYIPSNFGETYTSIVLGALLLSFGLLTLSVSFCNITKG